MSRPLRIEYDGAFYHVMNRGRARQNIFHDDSYYVMFLTVLEEACLRFNVRIHAYCLMSNHYHLLIETPEGNLQRVMRHIGSVYTQRYNRLMRTDGALFRGRYKAIVVDSDAYLLHLSKYIHLNPKEAKLVEALKDYQWSSYPSYIGKAKSVSWLSKEAVFGQLGGKRMKAARYCAYVEDSVLQADVSKFYRKERISPVLGDEAFVESLKVHIDKSSVETTKSDLACTRVTADAVIEEVARVYNLNVSDLLTSRKGRGVKNTPRKVAMYLVQRICALSLKDMAELFDLKHYGAVSSSIAKVRDMLGQDKKMDKKLNSIINRFDP